MHAQQTAASRLHAIVGHHKEGGLCLVDQNSANGTFIGVLPKHIVQLISMPVSPCLSMAAFVHVCLCLQNFDLISFPAAHACTLADGDRVRGNILTPLKDGSRIRFGDGAVSFLCACICLL